MIARLDGLLGRVTMYLLVIIWLAVIGVAAIVMGLIGQLSYAPLAIVANAAELLGVSLIANLVFGRIFRVRPQTASAVITALLLLFILPPTLEVSGLLSGALAALVATASKYVLAWRGRHVFNPAAVGAFVVVVTGQTFSAWWVATPPLLPFVALGALAILFRTRRLELGALFVVVASVGWGLNALLFGSSFLSGVQIALLSLPTVFFAGFMLSEPLTLPPRRWQQLVLAVVVGVLFATSWSVGNLSSSPEVSLLIGNLLAFLAGQRRGIRLEFVGRRQLSPTSWEFSFRPLKPVRFAAGQFMELTVPHEGTDARGWRRVFSIASAPSTDGSTAEVRFGIRLPEKPSSFKRALLALETGSRIPATSVGGDFTLPAAPDRKLLLVAGGIGITPFVGHLAELRSRGGAPRDVSLVYAVTRADDVAYIDELRDAGCAVAIAAPARPDGIPASWTWIDTTGLHSSVRLDGERLLAAVPDAHERHTYLSGPPAMIAELRTSLRKAGARRIRTDAFVGY